MIQDYAEKKLLDEVFATYLDVQQLRWRRCSRVPGAGS